MLLVDVMLLPRLAPMPFDVDARASQS